MIKKKTGLLIVAFALLIGGAFAFSSANDYTAMENTAETLLTDPSMGLGIIAPTVEISPSLVTINYIGASTTTEAIMKDVGGMIGIYWAIVKNYPEAGDLLITTEDINENPIGTFECLKSWVEGLDINDVGANQRVLLKVMRTIKTVS